MSVREEPRQLALELGVSRQPKARQPHLVHIDCPKCGRHLARVLRSGDRQCLGCLTVQTLEGSFYRF